MGHAPRLISVTHLAFLNYLMKPMNKCPCAPHRGQEFSFAAWPLERRRLSFLEKVVGRQ